MTKNKFGTIEDVKQTAIKIAEKYVSVDAKCININKYFSKVDWNEAHEFSAHAEGGIVSVMRNGDGVYVESFKVS